MSPMTIALIVASVACSSCSQVLLKLAMTGDRIQATIAGGNPASIALAVVSSPLVIGGLALFGLSAVLWLAVLARVPLSTAYPMIALGMVVTVVAGVWLFGETLGAVRLAGVALIVGGVLLLSL